MKHSVIGIDLAKNVFQICALKGRSTVVFNKRVSRSRLRHEIRQCEPTRIVMESCYAANYWGRTFQEMGHEVKLVPPWQVKAFVVGNKNDHNDALAIAEASMRPKIRFVPVKTLAQQDLQSMQRVRERWVRHRTAVLNQIRGLLSEYGIVVERSVSKLMGALPEVLEDADNGLTEIARALMAELYQEARGLSERITQIERQRDAQLADHPDCQRLRTVPGIGPVTAAELVAAVGDGKQFKNGRQMSAWIGLTPKQHASGEINRMRGMSKRGHRTLRRLLIHGARSVMNWCHTKDDKLNAWIRNLLTRMHPCRAIVAIANKLARTAWAILSRRVEYVES